VTSLEYKGLVRVEKGVRNRCFLKEETANLAETPPAASPLPAER
jgi:hypothetical protein